MFIRRHVPMTIWSCFCVFFVIGSTSAKSITIHNVTLSTDYSITAEALLKNVTKAVVEYDRNLDEYIKWVDLDKLFKEMEDHDGEYNVGNSGEVKAYFLQSKDDYFYAVTSIYGWCGEIDILIDAYVQLFNEYEEGVRDDQRDIIVNVLDEGIQKMTEALQHLDKSRDNLNKGLVVLTNVMGNVSEAFRGDKKEHAQKLHQLRQGAMNGFSGGILSGVINLIMVNEKYIPEAEANFGKLKSSFDFMKTKLRASVDKAMEIKEKLLAEIQNVVELRAAAKGNKVVLLKANYYNPVKTAANKLKTQCSMYQKKHGRKV